MTDRGADMRQVMQRRLTNLDKARDLAGFEGFDPLFFAHACGGTLDRHLPAVGVRCFGRAAAENA